MYKFAEKLTHWKFYGYHKKAFGLVFVINFIFYYSHNPKVLNNKCSDVFILILLQGSVSTLFSGSGVVKMDHKMKSVWKTECHLSAGSSWITIVVGVVMTLAAVVGVKSYKMCIKNRQKHSELCDLESESSVELQAHV